MPEEIFEIVTREWRERIPAIGGGRPVGILISVVLVAVLGVLLPLRVGQRWMSLSVVGIVSTCTASILSADYLLATLGAELDKRRGGDSRFPKSADESIVYGEIVVGSMYALLMVISVLLAGLATVNLVFPTPDVQMYSSADLIVTILASALVAEVFGGLAALILVATNEEWRARVVVISLILLIFIVPPFLYAAGPQSFRITLSQFILGVGKVRLAVTGLTFLLALDVAVLLWLRERVRNGGFGPF
ncbi:MAG: hypothetical protein ACLFS8_00305 [Clostridia bacterium]